MREIFIFIIQIQTRTQYNYDLIPPNSFYKVLKFVMGGGLCLISEEEDGCGGIKKCSMSCQNKLRPRSFIHKKSSNLFSHSLEKLFSSAGSVVCEMFVLAVLSSSLAITGLHWVTALGEQRYKKRL